MRTAAEGLLAHFSAPGMVTLCHAPQGRDALAIAELRTAAPERDIVFVACSDARLSQTAGALAFFAPDLQPLRLPAWDCLPYDRVSPRADICADRLRSLSALAGGSGGRLVLTTVNAAMQKLPPRAALVEARFALRPGAVLDTGRFAEWLGSNGYHRVGTVMEPGEYAFRGGLVDLFPAGAAAPVRVDLFGDEVESIRTFDPLSQRTTGEGGELVLLPASEVGLDEGAVARFRAGYRQLFGAVVREDALYETVSAGRRHPGMEHWLPLFHEQMESLFDYVPDALILFDHQADTVVEERRAQIADYYRARLESMSGGGSLDVPPYKPVPPERLFLDESEWSAVLSSRAAARFTPFKVPGGVELDGRRARDFAAERGSGDGALYPAVAEHVKAEINAGRRAVLACYSAGSRDRLSGLLADHGLPPAACVDAWPAAAALPPGTVAAAVLALEHGFCGGSLSILSEQDILGDRLARPAARPRRAANFLTEASALAEGDLVVHVDHGIGRYAGLETIEAGGAPHDCLLMHYAGNAKLYLPVENIEMLSRYGSGDADKVALDRLGSASWQARKARLKNRLRDMADALIRTAAARAVREAACMTATDEFYQEFAARFPFVETEDQEKAIDDCLRDLGQPAPMDRLICGDVGYGKTEVALRAAFMAAFSGKQTAVVVPTTLLCRQHTATFQERFKGLPVNIAQLSRLVPAKQAAAVRSGLASGGIDIVVGTHALLAKSVKFSDLGLLVIDEEQRFGVAQKERLKELKTDVHVLTLSATPIPRTLQLALTGVRSLSLITTPPVDRLAVRTFVLPYDPVVIREAILRERHRGGQIFYVCPRIADLDKVAAEIRRIVPDIKLVAAHGRMAVSRLEEAMTAFYDGQYELLVSTSIIESGLDMPRVNTLIVHRADMFGLAQLYQLRGRVGRGKRRAWAYFTVRSGQSLPETAEKRLGVIQALDTLGAGFSLASHDMDIRGAGNLLGEEQSGHVREVGIELYQQLLEEAVEAARSGDGAMAERWSPQITLGMAVLIPDAYAADLSVRLGLYRRLANLETDREIEAFAAELVDRFGLLPEPVENLLALVRIKRLCQAAGVERLDAGPKGAVVAFRGGSFAAPDKLVAFIARNAGTVRVRPDHSLVVTRPWQRDADRLAGVTDLIRTIAELAA